MSAENRTSSENSAAVSAPRAKIALYRKLLYAVVPLFVLLLTVEAICRAFPYKDKNVSFGDNVEADPDLIWRLRPRDSGHYQTNSFGLRDTPFNASADFKILLLGDSVALGEAVELTATFPYLLEQNLHARQPEKTFEVVNTAVPGYSTFQEAKLLELRGRQFEPNLILLQFCLNDVVERYHALAADGGDNVFMGVDTRLGIPGIRGQLIRNSSACERFMRLLQSTSRNRREYDVGRMVRNELSGALETAWQRTESEIEQIHQTAIEWRIPFLLVIAPYRFQFTDPQNLSQPQQRLLQHAERHGYPCVDLLPDLIRAAEQQHISPREFFFDANHFSLPGHYIVARLLVEPVQRALHDPPADSETGGRQIE